MIYLDYSATTKPSEEVLNEFLRISKNYYANANSMYKIAFDAKEELKKATIDIASALNINPNYLVFTSGASEANNQALKKTAMKSSKKTILTTLYEHSSINAPLSYLKELGYNIHYLVCDHNGIVDIGLMKRMITDDTFLISVGAVNSELGIRQPIEKIGEYLKDKDIIFHSDITQCLGKDHIDLTNVDLASFSAHKIFGIKGIGGLIKKPRVSIDPLIHGGKSLSIYRSGTPQNALICSMAVAIKNATDKLEEKITYIKKLNEKIINHVKQYNNVLINNTEASIPQIINISIKDKLSDDIQKYFQDHEIYLSTKTACSCKENVSIPILALTGDRQRALSCIRISISYVTTEEEVEEFLKVFDMYMGECNENN